MVILTVTIPTEAIRIKFARSIHAFIFVETSGGKSMFSNSAKQRWRDLLCLDIISLWERNSDNFLFKADTTEETSKFAFDSFSLPSKNNYIQQLYNQFQYIHKPIKILNHTININH